MEIRNLATANIEAIWAINEQGLPGTGRVSEQEVSDLLQFSSLSAGMFDGNELLGFVICLPPGTRYGSLNYQWFNDHYNAFVYVDRIAVSTLHTEIKALVQSCTRPLLLIQKERTYQLQQRLISILQIQAPFDSTNDLILNKSAYFITMRNP